ncbi:MAG: PTS sugar transporter subunit IIA [Eubacteriales bacterium]|nr:PTS sugar transporter subunit IIA [Eubacteriales bacterium]
MTKIIVVGHGRYASSVKDFLEIITGSVEGFYFVDFYKDDSSTSLREKLDKAVEEIKDNDILFICDLRGGSPFNESVKIAFEKSNMEVIAGANLAAISEIGFNLEKSAKELVDKLLNDTKESVKKLER